MTEIKPIAEWCAVLIEAIGIGLITGAALYVVIFTLYRFLNDKNTGESMEAGRQRLGRGILFGLEFLVAADIIYTVAVDLTLNSVGVLAAIVLIRTFLSFTIELELDGRWPWQKGGSPSRKQGD
jgi:uncharacterized membrane protein